MNDKPYFEVAVLLPIMNEAVTLERCLDSLMKQTLKSIVVIIQDNDSDDGSTEIISYYQRNFSNIYVNINASRIDSWVNWDLLWRYAEDTFDFEYLFWIGGDDYLLENNFFQILFNKGLASKLNVITPTINVIEGENGEFKKQVSIQLQSKIKFIRLLKYVNRWDNVNLLHSLIRKSLYQNIISNAGHSHTSYIANDWWFGAHIISKNQIQSLVNVHFCKSQWKSRRYQWIEKPHENTSGKTVNNRYVKFGKHLFQDFEILKNHIFHSHPLKHSLTKYEGSIITILHVVKIFYRPFVLSTRWIIFKFRAIRN